MEDTLRAIYISSKSTNCSLNPCFNGRYSQRLINLPSNILVVCLNPCFNGRYSQSPMLAAGLAALAAVLILVLMEDTLRAGLAALAAFIIAVLILVLMEDTLRDCSFL